MSDVERFKNNLMHSYCAYCAAVTWCCEARKRPFPFDVGNLQFQKSSDLDSVIIELGWAFMPRFYTILEQYHVALNCKNFSEFMNDYKNKMSSDDVDGLIKLTKLRNIIMHGDGNENNVRGHNKLGTPSDMEPHIMPEHINKFYQLLLRVFELS